MENKEPQTNVAEPEDDFIGPVKMLKRSINEFLDKIHILPLFGQMISARRVSEDNKKAATVTFMCPDEWVKNINGAPNRRDTYYVVRLPKLVTDIIKTVKEEPSTTDGAGN
jgi:hypothetical protein